MRTDLKVLLLLGFGATQMLAAAPTASAADLAVTPVKRTAVRVLHRSPVVRDYDGTPVVMGRTRVLGQYEMIPVRGAMPSRYFNGQPVLPNYPRGWPRRLVAWY